MATAREIALRHPNMSIGLVEKEKEVGMFSQSVSACVHVHTGLIIKILLWSDIFHFTLCCSTHFAYQCKKPA